MPVKILAFDTGGGRTAVSIIKFVIVPVGEVLWIRKLHVGRDGEIAYAVKSVKSFTFIKISYLDFFVRHPIANTRIELVQRLPSQLGIRQLLRRLHRAFEGGSPNLTQKGSP